MQLYVKLNPGQGEIPKLGLKMEELFWKTSGFGIRVHYKVFLKD